MDYTPKFYTLNCLQIWCCFLAGWKHSQAIDKAVKQDRLQEKTQMTPLATGFQTKYDPITSTFMSLRNKFLDG